MKNLKEQSQIANLQLKLKSGIYCKVAFLKSRQFVINSALTSIMRPETLILFYFLLMQSLFAVSDHTTKD